jgi:hypothetical protein
MIGEKDGEKGERFVEGGYELSGLMGENMHFNHSHSPPFLPLLFFLFLLLPSLLPPILYPFSFSSYSFSFSF